jgi:transcriptional regulator with XRE-family HTH domain
MIIGEKIKKLRKAKGWTQGQLALELDINRNQVSLWETGKFEPSVFNCVCLADVFNVTLDELCCRGERSE